MQAAEHGRPSAASGQAAATGPSGPARPGDKGPLAVVSRFFAWVAGGLILLSALLVSTDVLSRKLFSISMLNSFELSTYAFATAVTLGFAYALVAKSHVRIEVVYSLLTQKVQVILDVLSMLLLAGSATMLAYFALKTVQFSYRIDAHSNSTLAVPLAIPQGIWFFGLALFAATAWWLTIQSAYHLLVGRIHDISRNIGVIALQEELSLHGDIFESPPAEKVEQRHGRPMGSSQ